MSIEEFINAIEEYYNETKKTNSRYLSWEHCYKRFHDARYEKNPDIDSLCLNLAFYLASWGMYRGSSFLLNKDYKVHKTVIEEILDKKYNSLLGIECYKIKENKMIIEEIYSKISNYYGDVRRKVREKDIKSEPSATLVTKVLMGTLGCVPAYDRFFIDGIKGQNVSSGRYSIESISKLAEFYEKNKIRFEETRKKYIINNSDLVYPQMKLLDMGLWQIGFLANQK